MSEAAGKKKWNNKKDFEWDTEDSYGFVECTERRQIGVSHVTKGDYQYILLKDFKYYKKKPEDGGEAVEDWNVVKGFTIPLHAWKGIEEHVQELLNEHGDGE